MLLGLNRIKAYNLFLGFYGINFMLGGMGSSSRHAVGVLKLAMLAVGGVSSSCQLNVLVIVPVS